MREVIRQFVKICAETLTLDEPVYEFGSFKVPGQEVLADLRPFFPGKKYVGADMRHGPGVDVIINIHNITLPSSSVGTVILMETLEHIEFPFKAIEEIHRVLKPNGTLIMSSLMNFPIHDYPSDYWRFTPEAFKSLLNVFTSSFVDSVGEEDFPHSIVGVGVKDGVIRNFDEFLRSEKNWKNTWDKMPADISYGWRRLINPFVPPIILKLKKKIVHT